MIIILLSKRGILSLLCFLKDKEVEEDGWKSLCKFKASVSIGMTTGDQNDVFLRVYFYNIKI